MPKLQIPDRHQPGIAKIRDLDENSVRIIRNVLDQAPDTIIPPEITATDAALAAANIPDLEGILEALTSLYVLKSGKESLSLEQFAEDICDAMTSLKSDLKLTDAQRPSFKQKLLALLSADQFQTISKAFDLVTDDERIFCDARIITDLRPVFGTKIEDGPKGMAIVHSLKVGYHEGGKRHQAFYVSLDSRDLKELKRLLERAESKASALRSQSKGVRLFGIS